MKQIIHFFAILACLAVIIITGIWGFKSSYDFNKDCGGYLKRAATANTVPLAEIALSKAVKYLEDNSLTRGNTGIIFKLPKNDLTFLYDNLTASLKELRDIPAEASALEKSNVLMKLRETLERDDESNSLNIPAWMWIYPYQIAWIFAACLAAFCAIILIIYFCVALDLN